MAEDDAAPAEASSGTDDPGCAALLDKLSDDYSFDFREYRPASLVRRIRTRMSQVRVDTFEAYAQFLDAHPGEHAALFDTILINVTRFFRDAEAWRTLGEHVVPRLVAEAGEGRSLRAWSAGCSSGEEAYSLAILLAEELGDRASEFQVRIYGTDVDEAALAAARRAVYRAEELKDVPDALVKRYFVRDAHLWRVRRDIRRWCIFGAQNLAQAPPLSHVDLVVCRNVLIYFGSALQERIVSRFHYAIREGGYLFLGRSESLLARSRLFTPINLKWRIFQRAVSARHGAAPPDGVLPAAQARAEPMWSAAGAQRVLQALPMAAMLIDAADTILAWNTLAESLFETPVADAVGRKFRDIDVSYRVESLRARMEEVKARRATERIEGVTFTRRNGEPVHAHILLAPLFEADRFLGVLVSVEDPTEHAHLKEHVTRIAEQHATAIEELQSTNEELETTNEELQSTNEELETTNEELQSTNEELEATVEELQAANAELAALNSELEERGAELARLDAYHRGVVNTVAQAMFVIDRVGVVRTWNESAARMWGLRSEQVIGRELTTVTFGELARHTRPAFDRMLATGHVQQVERVPYAGSGPEPHAVLRMVPVKDGEGEIIGGVATAFPADGGH